MIRNNKMTTEYRQELRRIRKAVKGSYPVIAERTGMSIDTVRSVMTFRFMNEDVYNEAKKLARELNQSLN